MSRKLSTQLLEEAASQLITLAEASELSGLSQAHLRRLLLQGTIWGVKIGHSWVTTSDLVKAYIDTDRRTGPKSGGVNTPD